MARDAFSLILLDIQIPGMDGYAVTRALFNIPALIAVPVVAVASNAKTGDREKAPAAINNYLEKPINPGLFVAEVMRHVCAVRETNP